MKNNITVTILLLVIVAAGSFFGGMKYQQTKRNASFVQFNGQQGIRGNGAGQGQNRFRTGDNGNNRQTMGQIINQDDKSITVKMADSSTKLILLNNNTSVNKSSEGSIGDLKTGDTVVVFGTNNTDGSVTAQSIQLNPIFRGLNNPSTTPAPQK
jgi:hypothetical protein